MSEQQAHLFGLWVDSARAQRGDRLAAWRFVTNMPADLPVPVHGDAAGKVASPCLPRLGFRELGVDLGR